MNPLTWGTMGTELLISYDVSVVNNTVLVAFNRRSMKMTFDDIKAFQQKYISLESSGCIDDQNEANTSKKLVVPFLNKLGFAEEYLYFEEAVVKGKAIADITIKVNGRIIMFVEVKKASNKTIDTKDLHQITSYLNSKVVEWGILTNGKDYVLVNNEIRGDIKIKKS